MTLADLHVLSSKDHEVRAADDVQMLANLGDGALLEAWNGDAALCPAERGGHHRCDLDMPGMDGVEFLAPSLRAPCRAPRS